MNSPNGPQPLEGGGLHVPARYTPLLLAVLADAVRRGDPLPEVRDLLAACGIAARDYRATQVRLAALEGRAASAVASEANRGVLSIPQAGPPSDQEIDVSTAATGLGISAQRVRQLAKSGRLAGRQVNGCWWFRRDAVETLRRTRSAA